jgi:hypothetical protein
MLASGVSLRRVVLPIVLCAVALDALIILEQEYVIPIPEIARNLVRDREGDVPGTKRFPLRLMPDSSQTVWYSPNVEPAKKVIDKPLALVRSNNWEPIGIIRGPKAQPFVLDGQDGWAFIPDGPAHATLQPMGTTWKETPDTSRIWSYASPEGLLRSLTEQVIKMGKSPDKVQEIRSVENLAARDDRYGLTIRYEKFTPSEPPKDGSPRGGSLVNPRFQFQAADGQMLGTFVADSAKWVQERTDQGYWKLENGKLFRPSDLKLDEIVLRQSSRWLDYMSTSDLAELIKLKKVPNIRKALLTRHTRFTDPINNVVMLLLGLPFILSRERNIKASAGLCLLIVGIFYLFIYLCRYVGLSPDLAAWLPVLLFGPLSAVTMHSVKT